jgi:hypothetical protein
MNTDGRGCKRSRRVLIGERARSINAASGGPTSGLCGQRVRSGVDQPSLPSPPSEPSSTHIASPGGASGWEDQGQSADPGGWVARSRVRQTPSGPQANADTCRSSVLGRRAGTENASGQRQTSGRNKLSHVKTVIGHGQGHLSSYLLSQCGYPPRMAKRRSSLGAISRLRPARMDRRVPATTFEKLEHDRRSLWREAGFGMASARRSITTSGKSGPARHITPIFRAH